MRWLALLLISTLAQADVVLNIGVGKGIIDHNGTPFERVAAVGYQWPLKADMFIRPEAGYFEDISGSGKSSFWAAPLFGVRALSQAGPELHIAFGPGYLQNPDNVLGGHFQFDLEGGFSLTDDKNSLGLVWKHLSSAGIEMPNQGRDFIMIQWRILTL